MKNIYLLSRTDKIDYDNYDSVVVCANSEKEARKIHPSRFLCKSEIEKWKNNNLSRTDGWIFFDKIDTLKVKLIGQASDDIELGSVILASFNAG
jgi:hypothetical protein